MYVVCTLVVTIMLSQEYLVTEAYKQKSYPMNGKHLRVLANLLALEGEAKTNNATGMIEEILGASNEMMNYLTCRFNFTYSVVQGVTTTSVQSTSVMRGLLDYVVSGEADLIVGPVIMTPFRYAAVGMTMPWAQTAMYLMIPTPNVKANLTSVTKPFQWPVWASLLISLLIILGFLYMVNRFIRQSSSTLYQTEFPRKDKSSSTTINLNNRVHRKEQIVSNLYVIGILLYQGGPCITQKLSVRIIVATWCLAAAVLANSYSSVLITYVLAPNNPPLIQSVYDVVQNDNIKFVVDKGRGFDVVISTSVEEKGVFKQLRNKLNSYAFSRCMTRSECVQQVKFGGQVAYGSAYEYLAATISDEYRASGGKCLVQLAKEGFMRSLITWALTKGSPYTDTISKGFIELQGNGLMNFWGNLRFDVPRKCQKKNDRENSRASKTRRLSLQDLTGGFIVLFAGYGMSFATFLIEKAYEHKGLKERG